MVEENNNEEKKIEEKEEEKEKVLEKLKECQRLKEEYLNEWKRARAALINYKKEEATRIEEIKKLTKKNLILDILIPLLDNLDIFEKNINKENDFQKIIFFLKNQIEGFLKKESIIRMKTIGERFDPYFHEAIELVEGPEEEKGKIKEEILAGYLWEDKVLRPAKVKVVKF